MEGKTDSVDRAVWQEIYFGFISEYVVWSLFYTTEYSHLFAVVNVENEKSVIKGWCLQKWRMHGERNCTARVNCVKLLPVA